MKTKKEIRIYHKKLRNEINISDISEKILNKLFSLNEFIMSVNIFTYISMSEEIDTNPILKLTDKNIFVPKILSEKMIFTPYTPENLTVNKFGIKEPTGNTEITPTEKDIMLVPALACDKNFNRTGYGGGYYDRYLKNHKCIKIALLPDEFLLDEIHAEPHDIKVGFIITDKRVLVKQV